MADGISTRENKTVQLYVRVTPAFAAKIKAMIEHGIYANPSDFMMIAASNQMEKHLDFLSNLSVDRKVCVDDRNKREGAKPKRKE